MRTYILLISLLLIKTGCSQNEKTDIENVINQYISDELTNQSKYCYLTTNSLENEIKTDYLQKLEVRDILIHHHNFPIEFLQKNPNKTMQWDKFTLNKVQFEISIDPPPIKDIIFVDYSISKNAHDSIIESYPTQKIIVKKKKHWKEQNIRINKQFWNEFLKGYDDHLLRNPEKKILYAISNPVFSENKNFVKFVARIGPECNNTRYYYIYKNNNGKWTRIFWKNYISMKKCDSVH